MIKNPAIDAQWFVSTENMPAHCDGAKHVFSMLFHWDEHGDVPTQEEVSKQGHHKNGPCEPISHSKGGWTWNASQEDQVQEGGEENEESLCHFR